MQTKFHHQVRIPSDIDCPNPELEKALRVADFLELAQLMLADALSRKESCGAHFREEYQTQEGEAMRDDQNYSHIAAWEYVPGSDSIKYLENLSFSLLQLNKRSYK